MALKIGPDVAKRILNTSYCRRLTPCSVGGFHHTSFTMERKKTAAPLPTANKDLIHNSKVRGIDILRDPKLNKGQAFTLKERQLMGIHGLLPPCIITQDQQMIRVMSNIRKRTSDVDKYIYLLALMDRNERLFYRSLIEHVEELMPIVYTPTVGKACQEYGLLYRRPRGLFLSIKDTGHLYQMMCNWPEKDVKAIVVTDGERILGLGDLGVYGMGIPVGKLSLYTALGGIAPNQCLPIMLDVGTNNPKLLDDPLYIGARMNRITGEKYDAFLDDFMESVVKRFGRSTLIQFEDFGNNNAFRLLEKYRDSYCTFNDDIQGTAAVAAAGVFSSLRITGKKLSDNVFLMQGAGEANIGIGNLLALAMQSEGTSRKEALSKIWMVDSKGLIVNNRPKGGLSGHKKDFAKDHKPIDTLEEAVREIKPTALIGAAAIPGAFTKQILRDMAKFNKRPIIFALSNPTSMAECTAEEAYTETDGRCVFASGSPFDAVTYKGQKFIPGQGNNSYIFPGVALGIITCKVRHVPDDIFLHAAQSLAKLVTNHDLEEGRVYPPLNQIRDVSLQIATDVAEYAYRNKLASYYPEPPNKKEFIWKQLYSTDYESFVPETWSWPDQADQQI